MTNSPLSRRRFLAMAGGAPPLLAQVPGERPRRSPEVEVMNPRARVPLSFIIDDSTCLVNLNRFAIPQFRAAWADGSYAQDWRRMPVEIPDDFVRRFGEWCGEHGVKGKYSVVPYPACVGRLDRELPGWTPEEVAASIRLVRTLMMPNWDIHPEMVTHTRVIDLRTGHPYPQRTLEYMENWRWTAGKSVDEIAAYLSYALTILRNVELACEGVTTPGGFGEGALPQLAQATLQACRDVFRTQIPHYFRHAFSQGPESVAPRVEYASGLGGPDPRCVVSIIACTGDWTGNWDASRQPEPDRFITPDLASGRLVEVIGRGEPACLLAHWTGIHHNGHELGFRAFQEVVRRLEARYDNLLWMKLTDLARYWAAKELTGITREKTQLVFAAPFECPAFTVRVKSPGKPPLAQRRNGNSTPLREVPRLKDLTPGAWTRHGDALVISIDLPAGNSEVVFAG
jgi:hypothetical protein